MMAMHKTAYALVVVGALNWGLVGLFNFNLVSAIFGMWPMLEKLVYILIGLSAIYEAMIHMSYCKYCMMGGDKWDKGSMVTESMPKMTTKKSTKKKSRR